MTEDDRLYTLNANVSSILASVTAIQAYQVSQDARMVALTEQVRSNNVTSMAKHEEIQREHEKLKYAIWKVSVISGVVIGGIAFAGKEVLAFFTK